MVADTVARDPDVATYGAFLGGSRPMNNAAMYIALKPRDQRKLSADQIIARLRGEIAKLPGVAFFMQAPQDLNVGGRLARTQYQYTLQDADINQLNEWAPRLLEKMKTLPQLRDTATDQQTNGATVSLVIDRDQAARFGIQPALIDQTLYDAFGQNQITQYFTQLNSYHVILEIDPALQGNPDTLNTLYIKSPLTGQQVPLSTLAKFDTKPVGYLSVNHQGQFPAVTLSFNLAQGSALGEAVNAIQQAANEIGMPKAIVGTSRARRRRSRPRSRASRT